MCVAEESESQPCPAPPVLLKGCRIFWLFPIYKFLPRSREQEVEHAVQLLREGFAHRWPVNKQHGKLRTDARGGRGTRLPKG